MVVSWLWDLEVWGLMKDFVLLAVWVDSGLWYGLA